MPQFCSCCRLLRQSSRVAIVWQITKSLRSRTRALWCSCLLGPVCKRMLRAMVFMGVHRAMSRPSWGRVVERCHIRPASDNLVARPVRSRAQRRAMRIATNSWTWSLEHHRDLDWKLCLGVWWPRCSRPRGVCHNSSLRYQCMEDPKRMIADKRFHQKCQDPELGSAGDQRRVHVSRQNNASVDPVSAEEPPHHQE